MVIDESRLDVAVLRRADAVRATPLIVVVVDPLTGAPSRGVTRGGRRVPDARAGWRRPSDAAAGGEASVLADFFDREAPDRWRQAHPPTQNAAAVPQPRKVRSAPQKARVVGSKQPARWAKDHGFVHLIGMHLTLRTACRLAHENGSYAVLEAEHTALGLARDTSHPPSLERMLDLRNKRPPHLRWASPKPQRLPLPTD